MILLKSEKELDLLRKSGKILAEVMKKLEQKIKPGLSTQELDKLAGEWISEKGALAAFKGYKGFPGNICTSVNEEIVHGIPSEIKLQEGDIISLDLGVNYQGFFTDAAITVAVGKIDFQKKKLIEVTKAALLESLKQVKINNRISDIGNAVQKYVQARGFSVVRNFVGHGIGRSLHEEPEIPNFGLPGRGEVIKEGMVLAIEPMVNMGSWECIIVDNGWTAVTKDGFPSAHFEYTVAVNKEGPEILTKIYG